MTSHCWFMLALHPFSGLEKSQNCHITHYYHYSLFQSCKSLFFNGFNSFLSVFHLVWIQQVKHTEKALDMASHSLSDEDYEPQRKRFLGAAVVLTKKNGCLHREMSTFMGKDKVLNQGMILRIFMDFWGTWYFQTNPTSPSCTKMICPV